MARLTIHLLGPIGVALEGEPLTNFETKKAQALLAFLATEADRPHQRAALAEMLWPERPEGAARANLRHTLSNLRIAIGDRAPPAIRDAAAPFLLTTPGTIQFNRASDAWVDVAALSTLLPTGQAAHLRATPQAFPQLEEALRLYRGPFLEGMSLPDSPAFEEWMVFQRERFGRRVLDALHRLAEGYAWLGEYERALEYAWHQVEMESWDEAAQRQVMRLLTVTGHRDAALAQYQACKRRLEEELGVEPEEETVALYERLRDGVAPFPCRPAPPHNLPAALTPFVGRETELAVVQDRLLDPGCRLLALVGPGGMGKTRLAQEAARALVSQVPGAFAHGVYLVSLAPLASVDEIAPAVAQAVGFQFAPATAPGAEVEPERQLLDHLRSRQLLLILDGFEHLLDGADRVIRILRMAPNVKVMITSRIRLNLKGEHLFPVTGLDVPAPSPDIERDIARASAVQLFLQGARRVRPHLEPSAGELGTIARICRLLDGMPLAILLAAAWMERHTAAEIAAQLAEPEQALHLLAAGWRDVPARQRSIGALFDHSWNLLTGREREVFCRLAVFRGGFGRKAAQAVAGATWGELRALTDKSLLQRTATGRYELHDLLRQYAAARLAAAPDTLASISDRHGAYYAAALRQWGEDLKGARQRATLAEMDIEAGNIHAAWQWAVDQRRVNWLDQAMAGLCRFYEWRGRASEGETTCAAVAHTLSVATQGEDLRVRARALAWQSVFAERLGSLNLASQLARQSLQTLRDPVLAGIDTRSERAFASRQLARQAVHTNLGEARRLADESLALYRQLDQPWGIANVLDDLGWAATWSGQHVEAQCFYEECLGLRRALGDQRGMASALGMLGYNLCQQGKLEAAEHLLRESLAIRWEMADWEGIAEETSSLAILLNWLGRCEEAGALAEEAIASLKDMGDQVALSRLYGILASSSMLLGSYVRARAQAETSLSLAREAGSQREAGISCWLLGCVKVAEQACTEALPWLLESVSALQNVEMQDVLSSAYVGLGCAALGLGQLCQARQHLAEALRQAMEIHAWGSLIIVLAGVAALLAAEGHPEQAVELYGLASCYSLVSRSRWFEDVIGHRLVAAAAGLPPDVVAAARERGRAHDLEATCVELLAELGS
jgi:predicted ATPase